LPEFPRRRSPPWLTLLPGRADLPDVVQTELSYGFHRAFPRTLVVEGAPEHTSLHYVVQPLGFGFEEWDLTAKQLTGWIDVRGDIVGMIQLQEWTLHPWISRNEFLDATDSWSQGTADFGVAVASGWSIDQLAGGKPLVELSRVWMRPDHARRRLWAAVVRAVIRRRYARRFGLLLLNTWPADYKAEGIAALGWGGERVWEVRRTSLGRLAQAALGVKALPAGCVPDDRWWFWMALSDGVARPRHLR